jgi:hypothetical protein
MGPFTFCMAEKDIGIVVALSPEVKAWVDQQAEAEGLQAATWLRMQVFRMRRGMESRPLRVPPDTRRLEAILPGAVTYVADPEGVNQADEAAAGVDISAMVEERLAEAPQAQTAKATDDDIDIDAVMRRQMRVRPLRLPPETRRLEGTSGLSTIQRVAVVGGG